MTLNQNCASMVVFTREVSRVVTATRTVGWAAGAFRRFGLRTTDVSTADGGLPEAKGRR